MKGIASPERLFVDSFLSHNLLLCVDGETDTTRCAILSTASTRQAGAAVLLLVFLVVCFEREG